MLSTLHSICERANEQESDGLSPRYDYSDVPSGSCRWIGVSIERIAEFVYGESLVNQMVSMQAPEDEKLRRFEEMGVPVNISIDANDAVNGTMMMMKGSSVEVNVEYEKFLDWLRDASNHELYVRVKKYINTVNSILPRESVYEREMQSETLNYDMRTFVREALTTANTGLNGEQLEQYRLFLLKMLHIMCYDTVCDRL